MQYLYTSFVLKTQFMKTNKHLFVNDVPLVSQLKNFFCQLLSQGECLLTFSINQMQQNKWLVEMLLKSGDLDKFDFLALHDIESLRSRFVNLIQPTIDLNRLLLNDILKSVVQENYKYQTFIHRYEYGRVNLEITPYVRETKLVLYVYSTIAKLRPKTLNVKLNISAIENKTNQFVYPDKAYGDFAVNRLQTIQKQHQLELDANLALQSAITLNYNHQTSETEEKAAYKVERKHNKNKFSLEHEISDISNTGNLYNFDQLLLFTLPKPTDRLTIMIEIIISYKQNRKSSFYCFDLEKDTMTHPCCTTGIVGASQTGKTTFIRQIFDMASHVGPALEPTSTMVPYSFDQVSLTDIGVKSFRLLDTMALMPAAAAPVDFLDNFINGMKEGSELVPDISNSLSHLIITWSSHDLWVPQTWVGGIEQLEVKMIKFYQLVKIYFQAKTQFERKFPDASKRVIILLTHNDMIPDQNTMAGRTRLLFQTLVKSKLVQAGIPSQSHVFFIETTCTWKDQDLVTSSKLDHTHCQRTGFGCQGDLTVGSKTEILKVLKLILDE